MLWPRPEDSMMAPAPADPVAVVRRFFDVLWNGRDLSVADELFTPDSVTHQLRSAPGAVPSAPRTPEVIRRELAGWFAAFPDMRIELEEQTADGELVTTRCIARGTHAGAWLGVAPTGREITIRMVLTWRVAASRASRVQIPFAPRP
jgi:predicted ester cyclase